MKKLAILAAAGAATFAMAAPAQAATIVFDQTPDPCTVADTVCTFNFDTTIADDGAFAASGMFTLPQFGTAGATLTTTATFLNGALQGNIDFGSITLTDPNGNVLNFALTSGNLGGSSEIEVGGLTFNAIAGTYTLDVMGTLTNGPGGFGGDITFAAVPEPTTWMMMILGFGAIGFAMRGRKEKTRRISVNYA